MSSSYQASGLDSQGVDVDPQNPGTIIRVALIIESIANIPFAIVCFCYPSLGIDYFFSDSSSVHPAAKELVQLTGTALVLVSTLLAAALPNTRSGIECRRPAYVAIASAEAAMIGCFVYWGWVLGEEQSGCKKSALVVAILNIGTFASFRLFALIARPNWFGKYRIKAKGH